ncbi:hypothetical protein SAMN05660841_00773 [Sphingobacterium nematocida]|uniref:Uncharacterized protein n=1 Tax=Sphingobacterium nematocida TaxID=1513896 RepID=A0A1T5BKW4_9SPHI|nr:hypothetical protein SAMN05660841_00773 [Sphingobacterium nematocida]
MGEESNVKRRDSELMFKILFGILGSFNSLLVSLWFRVEENANLCGLYILY